MKASEIDEKFENGADFLNHFDLSKAHRPNLKNKRVNVDFPTWMVESLDREAKRLGVTRQSLIKLWLANKLEEKAHT